MRPEDSDPKTAGMHKAARTWASNIRSDEAKTRGEVIVGAGAAAAGCGAGAPAAPLPADFAELNGRLVASGAHFLGGAKPTKADAAAFDKVNAAVAGGAKLNAAALPGLSRWYDLVALFAPATRATWE
jgi:glutathione S-transferase